MGESAMEAVMQKSVLAGGLALGLALGTTAAAEEPSPLVKGTIVTLSGCVAGADSDSFVFTHVERLVPEVTTPAMLGASGMEGGEGEVIYWLSKDSVKKMRGHAGQRVEVTGKITDVSTGTVKIRQQPGKEGRDNKVEVEARGKDASAKTERPVEPGPTPPPGTKVVEKRQLPTYRVEVDTVKVVEGVCP
jgi:hypothetical protein